MFVCTREGSSDLEIFLVGNFKESNIYMNTKLSHILHVINLCVDCVFHTQEICTAFTFQPMNTVSHSKIDIQLDRYFACINQNFSVLKENGAANDQVSPQTHGFMALLQWQNAECWSSGVWYPRDTPLEQTSSQF